MPLVILSRGFISRSQFSVLSSQLPAPSSQRHASAQPNSRSLQRQAKTPNTCHLIFNVCHLILTLDIWYLVFVDGEQVLSMTGPLIRTMLISKYFTWIKTVDKIVAEHSWHVKFICLDGCGWCLVPPENKYLSRIKTLYLQIISHISYSLTVTLWLWHRGGLVCWDDHTLNIKSQYPNVVWLLWLARGGRWLRCNNGHIVAARYHLSTVAATGRVR